MLENTFCHLPGISAWMEQTLWEQGIHCWDALLSRSPLSERRSAAVAAQLHLSRQKLSERDARFFCRHLPARERWRLFPTFRDRTAFLDIETTGLNRESDHITTISLHDGSSTHHYVYGRNLQQFPADLREFRLLVTYNGTSFDLPFIRRHFGLELCQAHIDLMHLFRSLGITGGLKGCERRFGIARDELEEVDGYFAVLLWQEYLRTGCTRALETLLAYNSADAVNLESLLVIAYNLKLERTPFLHSHRLSPPEPYRSAFSPDPTTIALLKKRIPALRPAGDRLRPKK